MGSGFFYRIFYRMASNSPPPSNTKSSEANAKALLRGTERYQSTQTKRMFG